MAEKFDWDPFSADASKPQLDRYDDLRQRCPVAHSEALGWSLFRHEDVMRALMNPATFSNAVSAHLSVPNGMDAPEHTEYRRIIEPYFSAERMQAIEPRCRAIAAELIARLPASGEMEVMSQVAEDFALQAQCAFLGWPVELHAPLRSWVRKNHEAIRSRNRDAMAAVAMEFDGHIRQVLAERRNASNELPDDVASQLLKEQVRGRNLSDEEIVSILRNWTVGELATIAASVGILVHYLAEHTALQSQLRKNPTLVPAAVDEVLRIEAPLMTSRRITAAPVKVGDRTLGKGERITLMWASANRDERVFGDPQEFRLDRDPNLNLLYGAGIHVCPGAPLARLELRVFVEELLAKVDRLSIIPGKQPVRAVYPASGFGSLWIRLLKKS
jgi:cytochrome P450